MYLGLSVFYMQWLTQKSVERFLVYFCVLFNEFKQSGPRFIKLNIGYKKQQA